MADDDDKHDITRIEDLSEFLHAEDDEDFPDPDEGDGDFTSESTDPNMKIPGDITEADFDASDMGDFGGSDDGFGSSDFGDSDDDAFSGSDFGGGDFGGSDDDTFGGDDESFGGDFGGSDDDAFGGDDFNTSDETSSFSSDDFSNNDESENDDFSSSDDSDPFGNGDDDFSSGEVFEEESFSSDEGSDSFGDNETSDETFEDDNTSDEFSTNDFEEQQSTQDDEFNDTEIQPSAETAQQPAPSTPTPPPVVEQAAAPTPPVEPQRKEQVGGIEQTKPLVSTKPRQSTPEKIQKTENFEDVKKFGSNVTLGDFTVEGNPPFSVIVKRIKYIDDIEGIIEQLESIGYLKDNNKEQVEKSLKRGRLLISRISEFAAIYLCHKLREFSVDLEMGLSDEIHPPKEGETSEVQLTRRSILQNRSQAAYFKDQTVSPSEVYVSTTPSIEGHNIDNYLGIITHSKKVSLAVHDREQTDMDIQDETTKSLEDAIDKYTSTEFTNQGMQRYTRYFDEVVDELKIKAADKNANAIVGLNFQIIAIEPDKYIYEILGTGNVVWISKS